MVALILGILPLSILFMIATALALAVNYPKLADQKERIAANAGNVLAVVAVVFAAGVFTGILSGTKMIDAMAQSVVQVVPPALGPYLAVITAFLSVPFTFFISNDAFYYGVVPVLAEAGAHYGISAAEIGRASLLGQPVHLLSPLVPSTYLLVGLCGVEMGDHQKFTFKWALVTSLVLLVIGLLTTVIPLAARIAEAAHGGAGHGFVFLVQQVAAAEGERERAPGVAGPRVEHHVAVGDNRVVVVAEAVAHQARAAVEGEAAGEALHHEEAGDPFRHVGGGRCPCG
jgi:hypothetical protein